MSRRVSTVPLLLPLLLLTAISAAAGQRNPIDNPALHRLNDRVIVRVLAGEGVQNEVVCVYCLFQVMSAAYGIGNEVVRQEIWYTLGSMDPKALSEELLAEAERLPELNSTLTAYYQHGVFDRCPTRTKRDQCASIASLLRRRGESVDFRNRETKNRINTEVERATGGKIRNLFSSLPSNTQLVFASTLVFQANWPSVLSSVDGQFLLTDEGRRETVPTLSIDDVLPVLDGADGVQGVSLPYEHPAFRLYCFKATEEGKDVRELLNQQHYKSLANAELIFTRVRLPKFDVVSKKSSYVDFMKRMGILEMFAGGLGPHDALKVDQLVHKAIIQTDEHGTSAAGAAGISFVPLSAPLTPPFSLHFDRPFVCSLVHERLVQPLLTAYINNPLKQ